MLTHNEFKIGNAGAPNTRLLFFQRQKPAFVRPQPVRKHMLSVWMPRKRKRASAVRAVRAAGTGIQRV